jgi:hypothetical protein
MGKAKSKAIKPPAYEAEVFLPAGPGPINPLIYRGARNIRTLNAVFIFDLQDRWEKYGAQVLDIIIQKNPELFFKSIAKLAQIIRIEADVKLPATKPKTIEEVLQQVEREGGGEGRKTL